jgi:BirA family biotin operon repressor/biotin-[acetyl-CoA-carboxylase] ligase
MVLTSMDKVLLYLLKKKDFVSGEEIASSLSISRTAVWKHINLARERGIEIESVVGKGYRVKGIPEDKIIVEQLYNLSNESFPFKVLYLEEVDSTNTYAKKHIDEFGKENLMVITDNQLKGRGRFERSWVSEKGKDLTFSLVLHPDVDVKNFYHFTVISSLAVFDTIMSYISEAKRNLLKIKWPNDIYYEERKICGILSEMITEEMRLNSIIIGIGINVNSIKDLATSVSLVEITGKKVDRHEFLVLFARNFIHYFTLYCENKFEEIFLLWKKNLKNLRENVNFRCGDRNITGIFLDVEMDGSVIIDNGSGQSKYYAGEFL